MLLFRLWCLAVGGLLALPEVLAGFITVESIDDIPDGWSYDAAARDGDIVTLSVALKQRGMETLKKRLDVTSNPQHLEYGRRMSREEVLDAMRADNSTVDAVVNWLGRSGVARFHIDDASAIIKLSARVDIIKHMLNARELGYYSFRREGNDGEVGHSTPLLRARSYSLPREVRDHVAFVHPLNNFMPPILQNKPREDVAPNLGRRGIDLGACVNGTVPACIRDMYNITSAPEANTTSRGRLGVAGFLEQFINYGDVEAWREQYAPQLPDSYNFTVKLVNNGTNDQTIWRAGIEASLDVEYAMALAYPADITYYSTGGRGIKLGADGQEVPSDNEPYLEFNQYLLDLDDDEMPHVLSFSYADDEQSVPQPYAERVCDQFAALAARLVTVLVATGDGGANGIGRMQCKSNDGEETPRLLSTFPASCPYVTAVGATSASYPPVRAAAFSTGGFSEYFAQPTWQQDAVSEYLTGEDGVKDGLFNPEGRAIPDLSAVGNGFQIVYGGGPSTVLGTSASTPVVASMVTLAVDKRLQMGKGPLGWINPLLYSSGFSGILHDVQEGVSMGCKVNDTRFTGWEARPGWDAVTGLGALGDTHELLNILASIPDKNYGGGGY